VSKTSRARQRRVSGARGRRKLERAAMLHDRMQREADLIVEGVGVQARTAIDTQRRKT